MQRATAPEVLLAMAPTGLGRQEEHRRLVELAAELVGESPDGLSLVHRCPACGSTEHGTPALGGAAGRRVVVSLSRSSGRTLLAAGVGCRAVGVDLESPERVARGDIDAVAFSEGERAELAELPGEPALRLRTLAWTAKEALLKAAGTGLIVDSRRIVLDLASPVPHLVDGAAAGLDPARTHLVSYSRAGLVVTVAAVADRAPRIRWRGDACVSSITTNVAGFEPL